MTNPPTFFLVAGEASGDFIGAQLMKALKKTYVGARFIGIGGPGMHEQGLTSLFPYQQLSLIGLVEIIPHITKILKRLRQTANAVLTAHPDAVITIDSPGFNFRLAKLLRKSRVTCPLIHYVAPQVWAWRAKRAAKAAKLFDHLLCLFPFEPEHFTPHGLPTTFVGHPVVEMAVQPDPHFRSRLCIPKEARLITVLPGSRKGELNRLLPIFRDACLTLKSKWSSDIYALIPTLPHLKDQITHTFEGFSVPYQTLTTPDKLQGFIQSEAAIAASGTVTLELALTGLPAVVGYRLSPLTYAYARRLIKVPHISLVNILLKRDSIPELVQNACTPEAIADTLLSLITGEEKRALIKQDYAHVLSLLHPQPPETPSEAAVNAIKTYL